MSGPHGQEYSTMHVMGSMRENESDPASFAFLRGNFIQLSYM